MDDKGQRRTTGHVRGPPIQNETNSSRGTNFDMNGVMLSKFGNMNISSTNNHQPHLHHDHQQQHHHHANFSNGSGRGVIHTSQTTNGYLSSAPTLPSTYPTVANSSSGSHFDEFKQLLDCQYDSRRPSVLRRVVSNPPNPQIDSLKNSFKDVVFELSRDPASFDYYALNVVESLHLASDVQPIHPEVCQDMVSTLVKWAILSENFRFSATRLANYLALPDNLPFDFKKYFLECVTSECFMKLNRVIGCTTEDEEKLLEGIMLFLSELYVNMGDVTVDENTKHIVSNTRMDVLKNTLQDAILIILEKAYSDKPLETVGKVLKLTGAALDENLGLSSKADQDKMNRIFTHVDALTKADYTAQKVKTLFRRVLQLRKNLWQSPESGQANFANVSSSATGNHSATSGANSMQGAPTNNDSFRNYDVPVFYLSDGTPIPAHEADFVESDALNSNDRFMYLHGEGDIPSSHVNAVNNAVSNDFQQVISHVMTQEEEEAFNEFLSTMS